MDLSHKINVDAQEIIAWRRHFHKYPELSFKEEKTSRYISGLLQKFGLEVQTNVGGYGVIACLYGQKPGPTVALRADMDALPLQDEKNAPYSSTAPGVMHACGHDGHMSMLLGAARYLAAHASELRGEVRFLFQPAEESVPGGALRLLQEGGLRGVDQVYGLHLWTGFPTGTLFVRSGPLMAASDHFDLLIQGKGGHGAMPHQTVDAVVTAAQAVTQLQTVVSRRISPLQPAVLTIGSFHAGSIYNVIAERAELKGTVRTFEQTVRNQIKELMEQTLQGVCSGSGATFDFDYLYGFPPVINEPTATDRLRTSAAKVIDTDNIRDMEPVMVGEDFGRYLEQVPGCFAFIGCGGPDSYPHHHPKFDIDERALEIGTKIWIQLILDLCG